MQSNVKPCNRFEFSHTSSPPAITASHFLHYFLVDQLYAKEVKCISAVLWQNAIKQSTIHQIFIRCIHVSIGPSHMESSTRFSQSPPIPPPPPPLKWGFPTFHYRTSSFCCHHILFQFQSFLTPNSLQKINNISIGPGKPPHTFFCFKQNSLSGAPFFPPHWNTPSKVHAVSIDPDVPPLMQLGFNRFICKNILLRWSPFFFVFVPPNKNPPKRLMQFQRPPNPSSIPWNKSRRHMNPVISN